MVSTDQEEDIGRKMISHCLEWHIVRRIDIPGTDRCWWHYCRVSGTRVAIVLN